MKHPVRRAAFLPLALLLAAPAGPSLAQAPAQAPAAPPRPATTWEAVDQPLNALLDGGYRIVAMTGPGFTLEKGGKYLLCEVRTPGGMRGSATATSECHRLN
ncbi:hypothetical protein [Roseomonas elaeocarpi]|uniref:Uncharacterized protein n=1 Tax=Roseomonas elaeocarpi TaxID=907779 RepID=A0ABV6JP04_9PROT